MPNSEQRGRQMQSCPPGIETTAPEESYLQPGHFAVIYIFFFFATANKMIQGSTVMNINYFLSGAE